MELFERLSGNRPEAVPVTQDPFAELKDAIHRAVISGLGPRLFNTETDPETLRQRVIADIEAQLSQESGISREDRDRLMTDVADDILGHGPIERLLADETITEIMVNGPHDIWIERGGRLHQTPIRFNDDSHLRRIINKMVAQVGRRIDESSPMVDARLPDGSRVNAIIHPLSLSGPLVTIRKFPDRRMDLADLVRLRTLTTETVDFLQRCVSAKLNILICGGTGSGKTTLLNALSSAIPDEDRIVTVEETAELRLIQRHVLRLESRPENLEGEGEITIRELVRNTLRMRPDRIIVGEVRQQESLDLLIALNSGLPGMCSIHANSAREAIVKLCTLPLLAGENVSHSFVVPTVASCVDLVVHVAKDGTGHRRVREIVAVPGRVEGDVVEVADLFVTRNGRLSRADGYPPHPERFEWAGIDLPTLLAQDV
jgi:pilus assembly protein CpaF